MAKSITHIQVLVFKNIINGNKKNLWESPYLPTMDTAVPSPVTEPERACSTELLNKRWILMNVISTANWFNAMSIYKTGKNQGLKCNKKSRNIVTFI